MVRGAWHTASCTSNRVTGQNVELNRLGMIVGTRGMCMRN